MVSVKSNIPMICDDENGTCSATFAVHQSDTDLLISTCTVTFRTDGNTTMLQLQKLSIVAARDFVDDGDKDIEIEFRLMTVTGAQEWVNYSMPIPDELLAANNPGLTLNVILFLYNYIHSYFKVNALADDMLIEVDGVYV